MLYVQRIASIGSHVRRLGLPVVAFMLLVVIGRQITPQSSLASFQSIDSPQMGTLTGSVYKVELVVTDQGPRYTVRSETGRLLAWQLDLDGLAREFPQLDLRSATASPLMSAEKHTESVGERP